MFEAKHENKTKQKQTGKFEKPDWISHVTKAVESSNNERGKFLKLKILSRRVGALVIFENYSNDWLLMLLQASVTVGGISMTLAQESLNRALKEVNT